MIHGHTHKPARHALNFDITQADGCTLAAERIVLGDWDRVLTYLKVDASGLQLIEQPVIPG